MALTCRVVVAILIWATGECAWSAAQEAGGERAPKDYTDVSLKELGITQFEPKKDLETGFVVGGVNETKAIRNLKKINGIAIADLEKSMRPGGLSDAGFLGKDERLLDVMAADNEFVLKAGLTHQQIALQLRIFEELVREVDSVEKPITGLTVVTKPFTYRGSNFQVKKVIYKGSQESPFQDDTSGSVDYFLTNLGTGE
ncbi:MAG: hypothetical protein C0467_19650, partial [Planctomycetaceae bacterium]|nr:hypothetical protein [Planctomycetaceae bacterium]